MLREILTTILALLLWVGLYACVRAFFSSIKRSALRQEPRQNGIALEFFPVARMQFLVRLILVLLVAFTILVTAGAAVSGAGYNALLAPLVPMSVFILILLTQPVTVVLDQEGIRQLRWFLHNNEWKGITSVAYRANTGTIYVRSKKGGPKIRFSIFLVGRARFRHEIRAHARDIDIQQDD